MVMVSSLSVVRVVASPSSFVNSSLVALSVAVIPAPVLVVSRLSAVIPEDPSKDVAEPSTASLAMIVIESPVLVSKSPASEAFIVMVAVIVFRTPLTFCLRAFNSSGEGFSASVTK